MKQKKVKRKKGKKDKLKRKYFYLFKSIFFFLNKNYKKIKN